MRHLTVEQRYTISVMLQKGFRQIEMAQTIGKDKSVVSWEIKRNCDLRNGEYRFGLAQRKYKERLQNKPWPLRFTGSMKEMVADRLVGKWSPE